MVFKHIHVDCKVCCFECCLYNCSFYLDNHLLTISVYCYCSLHGEARGAVITISGLLQMVTSEEFAQLIIQDAQSIEKRQESDSIDVVDSVRFHLTSHVQTYSEMEDGNRKLALVDDLLESLGFDC